MILDDDACRAALCARDARFDGLFFVGVATTGIYCRPICPARTPRADRCAYFASPAAAESAGFRACLRCRPERAPGTAPIDAPSRLVRRAIGRIDAGALDRASVEALATGLGVSSRHLRRAFDAEIGASPLDLALTRRVALARQLLRDTGLPIGEVATAAGFPSVRRLNAAFQSRMKATPTAIRRTTSASPTIQIRVDTRPPFDGAHLLEWLGGRAIPGVEAVDGDVYSRTVGIGVRTGTLSVRLLGEASLEVHVSSSLGAVLPQVLARVRRLFDADARPDRVGAHLGGDPILGERLRRRPGLRVPGAFDPAELAIRALLGQQVSVKAATTLSGRLVAAFGEVFPGEEPRLGRLFPPAARLAEASVDALAAIGLPGARATALRDLAAAIAGGDVDLDAGADPEATVASLRAIRGIGPWTANYIAMRALGWPDAFPAGDLVVKQALGVTSERAAEAASAPWRPWRAYATMHLWNGGGG